MGSRGVNAVGLIRSLGKSNIKVTFASSWDRIDSKWARDYLRLPCDVNAKLSKLIQYIETLGCKPVIYPTDDESAYFLDDHYRALKEICYFSNAEEKLRSIADKAKMAQMASECGLAVPDFQKISLQTELQMPENFPVIVKPYAGFAGDKGDIRICEDKNSYIRTIGELKDKGYMDILVQYYLHEEKQYEIGLMGISFGDGTVIIPCTIHKIRSYPTGRGSTSYAKIEPGIDTADETSLKKFVVSTGYVGIFDIEMMISGGAAYFIEINYRNGQYGYAPTAAGYNLPANWYYGVMEHRANSVDHIVPLYYMNEREDFLHVKHGEIQFKQWHSEFRKATAYGMYCREDMMPYIRQYVKIPDRVKLKCNKIFKRVKDLFINEEWNIAFRPIDGPKLYEANGTGAKFTVLKNNWRYWAADPFMISIDHRDYIFFEMYDRIKGKGLLGYREITNGKAEKMKIAYEEEHHLSFPFIFVYEGSVYIMPESSESNNLFLLKAEQFPFQWHIETVFINDKKLCDSVLWNAADHEYLFTQEFDTHYIFDSLSLYVFENGKWIPHRNNPIVKDIGNARPAGKLFAENDRLIRVSQDCTDGYGCAINFNQITKLSPMDYSEKRFNRITADDIRRNQKSGKFMGIHTYNSNENYEVIDLKNKDKLHVGNIINVFRRLIRK